MSDWPDHVKFDVTLEANFRRLSRLKAFIVEKGGFQPEIAQRSLVGDVEAIESVSKWIRREVQALNEAGESGISAAVRRGIVESPIEISDLAMTLAEGLIDETRSRTHKMIPLRGQM
jgi:hypothetical protein